jgi:hypothetical protein
MKPSTRAIPALVAALLALSGGSAAADCRQLAAAVRSAIAAVATPRYDALYAQVKADATCDARFRSQVGRTMARSLLTTLPVDSAPSAIAAVLRFGRPWQVLVALGDAYYDRQDFANAGDAYQEALTDMADAAANPTPPQPKVVERVQQRALQSGTLLPPGDMFASRGFAGTPAAGPAILAFFAGGSADLGAVGKAGIEAAFPGIAKAAPKGLILIGHADPGEDPGLAEARARTVAAYLDELGYAGRITTSTSDKPFKAEEPEKLPPEQKEKLERRVEYAPGD